MSFNFGGSSKKERGTTQVVMPPASAGEEELRQLNLQFAKEQMERMRQMDAEAAAYANSPQGQMEQQINQKAQQNILARLTGQAPVLSPEEQGRLDTIYNTASQRGMDDLSRFGRDMADARGMSTADSPIGNDLVAQGRKFQEGLTAQRAGAALDQGNANAAFNQQLAMFQSQLAQQAFQNRMALAATTPVGMQYGNSLFAQRLATAPRTSSGSASGSQYGYGFDLGSLMSGAGGAMRGWGSMGGGGLSQPAYNQWV